jgi:hypothetical protein
MIGISLWRSDLDGAHGERTPSRRQFGCRQRDPPAEVLGGAEVRP